MSVGTLSKEQAAAVAYFEQKLAFEIGPVGLKMALEKGEKFQIVDLRTPELYAKGHIPGAINILFENLDENLSKLSKDTTTVVYCYDVLCHLATRVALELAKKGYKVQELHGGFDGWADHQFQIEGKAHKAGSCGTSCA
ncbi:MAG: hypothetical protein K2W82_01240 [Candidatus Obscuribacterales bacterium]|nr:hypothetical protein [Candidatus Obscuribacterales bacterium]